MIVGHYAAALVPYAKLENRPLWLLLVCENKWGQTPFEVE
jgi:hypothetical protein